VALFPIVNSPPDLYPVLLSGPAPTRVGASVGACHLQTTTLRYGGLSENA